MSERLSRKALYDLVWSEPMRTLSVRFGISDVALKKTCLRADIPTPDRGYWAKKEAGKPTFRALLPDRWLGMDEEVLVAGGQDHWYRQWDDNELLGPLPDPPAFYESIEGIKERVTKLIGKVTVLRDVHAWNSVIERFYKEDEKRREDQRSSSFRSLFNEPIFDFPFERRRFKILNALAVGTAKVRG